MSAPQQASSHPLVQRCTEEERATVFGSERLCWLYGAYGRGCAEARAIVHRPHCVSVKKNGCTTRKMNISGQTVLVYKKLRFQCTICDVQLSITWDKSAADFKYSAGFDQSRHKQECGAPPVPSTNYLSFDSEISNLFKRFMDQAISDGLFPEVFTPSQFVSRITNSLKSFLALNLLFLNRLIGLKCRGFVLQNLTTFTKITSKHYSN